MTVATAVRPPRTIKFLDQHGDTPVKITDAASEQVARDMFEKAMANKSRAMVMEHQSEGSPPKGKKITSFDEVGEDTLIMPQLQGG